MSLKIFKPWLSLGLVTLSGCTCVRQTVKDCRLQIETPSRTEIRNHRLRTLDHLVVDSHLLGVGPRPVSSTYQFLTWSTGTTVDLISPKPPRFLENPTSTPLKQGPGMNLAEWEKSLDEKVGGINTRGSIKLFSEGDTYFRRLENAINESERSIHLRTFVFDNDDCGVRIADLLKKKSSSVDVKVLLDGLGQILGEGTDPETLPASYESPGPMSNYLTEKSKIKVRVRPSVWLKADHTKSIIIDRKICFTGGMNIGREYRYEWQDVMMEMKGPVVSEMTKEFELAWAYASRLGDLRFLPSAITRHLIESKAEESAHPPLRLLLTRPGSPQIYRAQIAAIKAAQRYIYISNAYLSHNTFISELIKARHRGVDVRVILPLEGNHEVMNKSNVITANDLFRNGVRVFFYPGMSHLKVAVYDGWLCTGSANYDKLSLKNNLELNIGTSHRETVEQFQKEVFEASFSLSIEMTAPIEHGIPELIAEMIAEAL